MTEKILYDTIYYELIIDVFTLLSKAIMKKIDISKIDYRAPKNMNKEETLLKTEEMKLEIIELQRRFYAGGKNSMLIVLQGMDASGKDGTVKKVFSGVNPLGIRVSAFGKPSQEAMAHDFLWRLHKETPRKGMIRVFNRSYYEDILVPTVEWYLDEKTIEKRYKHINNFEEMLADEGTIILKFYLHMSKEKQKERLLERITIERKFWKYDASDAKARKNWDSYIDTYKNIFDKTHTKHAEWNVIPTDQKWYKVYCVTKKVLETLREHAPDWPKLKDHPELGINKEKHKK